MWANNQYSFLPGVYKGKGDVVVTELITTEWNGEMFVESDDPVVVYRDLIMGAKYTTYSMRMNEFKVMYHKE